MEYEEIIEKINYYDKNIYTNWEKGLGIIGFANYKLRCHKINNTTKEEKIRYYEQLLQIVIEEQKKILQEKEKLKKENSWMLILGGLESSKVKLDYAKNLIENKINKEKGIKTEFDILMEEFLK